MRRIVSIVVYVVTITGQGLMILGWAGLVEFPEDTFHGRIFGRPSAAEVELEVEATKALPCTRYLAPAGTYTKLVAYYLHENPRGWRWVSEQEAGPFPIDTYLYATVEGWPAVVEWMTRATPADPWTVAVNCGGPRPDPRYPRIFDDGFETGTTSRWSLTQPPFHPPPASPSSLERRP